MATVKSFKGKVSNISLSSERNIFMVAIYHINYVDKTKITLLYSPTNATPQFL